MSQPVFDSRSTKYKSVFGAVKRDVRINFRLLLPVDNGGCHAARMVLYPDDGGIQYFDFWPTNNYEDGCRWWELYFQPAKTGLFWYSFEYDNLYGTHHVFKGDRSQGYIGDSGPSWQLTVYDAAYRTPDWLKGGVIYQIFPDRFLCSGQPKNNVPSDRIIKNDPSFFPEWEPDSQGKMKNNDYYGGDLKGIESKLDYLKSLGVNCIYLNPIFESHSNHRYNTADYSKVDPLLGNEKDFKSLCDEAARRDMHIILDGVFSHTGDDSIYFNKYKRYKGDPGAYNSKDSKYYKWYKFDKWPDEYKSWWGIDVLPEVIEEDPDYLDYITGPGGIVEKWLNLGADGFRLDVADELPDVFLDKLRERVKAVKPYAVILGEVWEDASNKISYGIRRRYLQGAELDTVMNYPFAQDIIDFVRTADADDFLEKVTTIMENYPAPVADILMNHLSTHDTARILSVLGGEDCEGKDRRWQFSHPLTFAQYEKAVNMLYIASALQYTLPGVPSLYYGDEAGMSGYKDPFNRGIYPWGKEDERLVSWYKMLGKFRSEHKALKDGDFIPVSAALSCVAYARKKGNDEVFVIANRNDHEIDYYLHPEFSGLNPLLGCTMDNGSLVKVPANTCAILTK